MLSEIRKPLTRRPAVVRRGQKRKRPDKLAPSQWPRRRSEDAGDRRGWEKLRCDSAADSYLAGTGLQGKLWRHGVVTAVPSKAGRDSAPVRDWMGRGVSPFLARREEMGRGGLYGLIAADAL